MAAKLPGFRRVRGGARRYETPGGQTISYRQYRETLKAAGAVRPLSSVDLANQRRAQRGYNDIINQMAKVRARSLDRAIELAEELDDEEELEDLLAQRRHLKSSLIKSGTVKAAKEDLKTYAHKKSPEAMERTKLALIALGRREGIPDWVPVGGSDRFRSGNLRRPRSRVNATGRNF